MSYYQTIPFSEKIVPGKVKAKVTDGVLDVTIPERSLRQPLRKEL